MTFKKGEKVKNQGNRGPGKATKDAREAVGRFVDLSAPRMLDWLEQVSTGIPEHKIPPNPSKAIELVQSLLEYHIPKLARTELAGDKENPIKLEFGWK